MTNQKNTMPTTNPRYDGSDSGPIDLATAQLWTQNFQNASAPGEVRSHYFGRNIIDQVLAQPGCKGIRIYYALNDQGAKELVIAGVNGTGGTLKFVLADASYPCPPICPPDEIL
jgi:hypothetical protein